MKVSICMITYNHQRYIAQAINGIIMQKTNFNYELIIGEDCSTDNTRNICLEFQKANPKKIQLILNESNLGMYPNFINTLAACNSKYIAFCEGDDYWIDPYKLQKQVDFLEKNSQYAMCFHNAFELINENKNMNLFSSIEDKDYVGQEILKDWLIPSASVLFRQNIINEPIFKKVFSSSKIVYLDILLFLIAAEHGKIYGMKEPMAVYRRHSDGITQKEPDFKNMKKMITHLNYIGELFNNKYYSLTKMLSTERAYYYGHTCILKLNFIQAFYFYFYAFINTPKHFFKIIIKDLKNRLKK